MGWIKFALSFIPWSGNLRNMMRIYQLFENACQALFCNLEDVQELGNSKPRLTVNEMQYPVMRSSLAG